MTNELMEKPTEYLTDTGDEIKLTMSMVRKYLVSGKGELTTDQELVFFIKTCQARKLNPFLRECYLVKYDNSPAAIITARSTFQNNARAAADCQGWHFGPIVQDKNGEVRESAGLVLENEKVVGGWFSAKPKGWDEPFTLQVNLNQYIKKTRDGRPTQFWTPEKQAGMIAKVAEVQGLRTLWGKRTAGMYEADEIVDNGLDFTPLHGDEKDSEDFTPAMTFDYKKPEDFDNEFETEMSDEKWPAFWGQAVDFHAKQKPPISEDQLKIDIISGEVAKFRVAFNNFIAPEPDKKKAAAKKTAPKKAKPKSKTATAAEKKKAELKEQADMLESEAYAGVEAYKEHFPDIYHDETGGKDPKTTKDCQELLDRMQAVREAREASQDAGDDIPY